MEITPQQFADNCRRAWHYQVPREGLDVLRQMENKELVKNFEQNELAEIKIRMQWVAFPIIPEKDQFELLSSNLLIPLYDENFQFDIPISIKQLSTPLSIWPEETVPKIINTLMENDEKIGHTALTDKRTGQAISPTIGNWLKDYSHFFGIDKQDVIVINKYLSESKEAQALSLKERAVLKKLLTFFESIKVFSISQIKKETEKIIASEKKLSSNDFYTNKTSVPSVFKKIENSPSNSIPHSPSNPQPDFLKQEEIENSFSSKQEVALFPEEIKPISISSEQKPLVKNSTIKDLLQANPRIANQKITSNPLILLGKEDSDASPNIENWLWDYRSRFGISGHTEEDRHEFLFRSPNTQGLSEEERGYVQTVIDSYDKDSLLSVSEETGKIIFE